MSTEDIIKLVLGPTGSVVILIILLWAGHKRIWVWGWYANELKQYNTRLENKLDKAIGSSGNATSLLVKAVEKVEESNQ